MVTHATHDPPRGVSTHSKPEQRDLYVAATGTPAHIWPRCECDSFCSGPPTSTKPVKTAVPFRRDKIRGIGVTLSRKRELCPENGSAVLKRVLRSSEACFGRGGPANYLELELICPQNGSTVLKRARTTVPRVKTLACRHRHRRWPYSCCSRWQTITKGHD